MTLPVEMTHAPSLFCQTASGQELKVALREKESQLSEETRKLTTRCVCVRGCACSCVTHKTERDSF